MNAEGIANTIVGSFGLFLFVAFTYFLPTTIAVMRNFEKKGAVFLVNLLVGWTLIGWIIALVWSLQGPSTQRGKSATGCLLIAAALFVLFTIWTNFL